MNSMVELTEPKAVNCPNCKSAHIVKIGTRNGYQRYLCRTCSKKFHNNGKAKGRRFPANQMGAAIRQFYSGMSYKRIAESMETMYGIPQPSKATIYEWVRDYTKAALREMERHPAHTGGRWVVDDMQLNVAGQKYWIWNVMDEGTRYLLASHLTKERDARSAEAVLKKAVAAATDPPRTVRTDRRRYYIPAVKNVAPDARHIQSPSVRDWKNNNLSEAVRDAFRQRTQSLRGVSSKEGGHLYLDGWTLSYNLFIDHESMDGKLSGQAAKVDAPFNEWADVVRKVASYSRPKRPPIPEGADVRPFVPSGPRPDRPPISEDADVSPFVPSDPKPDRPPIPEDADVSPFVPSDPKPDRPPIPEGADVRPFVPSGPRPDRPPISEGADVATTEQPSPKQSKVRRRTPAHLKPKSGYKPRGPRAKANKSRV